MSDKPRKPTAEERAQHDRLAELVGRVPNYSGGWAPARGKLDAYLPGGAKYRGVREATLKDDQVEEWEEESD